MMKHCFCGKAIPVNWRLCKEHAAEYGTDPEQWDDWLKFLMTDIKREYDQDRNSHEIDDCDIEIIHRDPRVTLLERFDTDGFIVLRGCEGCE